MIDLTVYKIETEYIQESHVKSAETTQWSKCTLLPGSTVVQRCFTVPVLIDHFPHVNSISNSLTNSGDVSSLTSIEQIPSRHFGARGARSELAEQELINYHKDVITSGHDDVHCDCACVKLMYDCSRSNSGQCAD